MARSGKKALKILMVNKYFRPFGGVESYMFGWKKLFEEKGHSVIFFSMKHPQNLPCPQSKYFVEQVDYSDLSQPGFVEKLRMSLRIIYNLEAKRKMEALIRDEKPDIAHFQNIYHQLSPSIIYPLVKHNIPIVMKLADYKLICLNYRFISNHRICNACETGHYWKAIPAKCVKDSYGATIVNLVEHYAHKFLGVYKKIDLLISPSHFLRKKHIAMGINPRQITTIENFKALETYRPHYEHDNYILFFGRVVLEKGIKTLIKAFGDLPDIPLRIAGNGPDKELLQKFTQDQDIKNVEFVGFKTGDDLAHLIKNATFTVVPSEWYENCSNTVIEAFAYGKPVIGSDIGGIPEQVLHGRNGYLFQPGNVQQLSGLIRKLYDSPDLVRQMGMEARRTVETKYSDERHYKRLLDVYRRLIAEKAGLSVGDRVR